MDTWHAVDEPVLRWLLGQRDDPEWTGMVRELQLRTPEPRPEFGPDLDSRQVDDALTRLEGHRLIAGVRQETVAYAIWSRLRVAADGLIVLGEWPDLDRVAGFEGLRTLIAKLAEQTADDDDKAALRRTAGVIGQLGEGVVGSVLEALGGEIG